jgi:hypothetical protein
MTSEEFTSQLPVFANDPLPIKPPFAFKGLSARIFPLRANLDALQQLCNGYLNFVPPEVGRFRAVVPYVYLAMLDYGQISEVVTSLGWFAQVEVFFCVPVEWYKVVNGKWVFHDWAVITPFIYVDDDISVPTGRGVYGFPKALAKITPAASQWITDPVAPVTLARVETAVFPELYQGRRLESRVFLEVQRDAPMSNFQVPPDMRSPIMPWVVASNLAQALGGLGRDAMWLAQAMRIFPINPAVDSAFVPEMLDRLGPALAPGGPGFVLNSLNLKQFRRSDAPMRICYQGLTNGRMQMTAFNGGGLLGEERTLLGDLSGGHTVKLHEYSSLPIARTLGLDVHRRFRSDGIDVAELKPVMPFWIDVNVLYQQGINLVWRTRDSVWKDGAGAQINPAQKPAATADAPPYNTTVASVIEAVAGPFQFSGTTIRVLPLLAHRRRLQAFLDTDINDALNSPMRREDGTGEEHVRLSVWARPPTPVNAGRPIGGEFAYVYLTASSYADVTSKTNNIGDWAKYELSFLIPVKLERQAANGDWNVEGVGLVPAFSFMDDSVGAVSRVEVLGIPTISATFVRPESVWLAEGEPSSRAMQTLLRLDAEVIPALGVGQPASMHAVLEIRGHDDGTGLGDAGSRTTPFEWAEALRLELGTKNGVKTAFPDKCKVARALALELLGNRVPVALYSLKQFRDVADPEKACYQSLVRVPRVFKEIFDLKEIEETIVIHLHDFPTLKIVEALGLIATTLQETGAGIVYAAQAVRPFYIRATVDEPLSQGLASRAGTPTWNLSGDAFRTILSDEAGAPPITVDGRAETLQDQSDPCRIPAIMYQAHERLGRSETAITKDDARQALAVVDPQMVIESVLSREWGNIDENARWRRGRQELIDAYDTLLSGASNDLAAAAESTIYTLANSQRAARPGRPDNLGGIVATMIDHLRIFTTKRFEMEKHFSALADWSILRLERQQNPTLVSAPPPTAAALCDEVRALVASLKAITALDVVGEPSPHNNLDTQVLGDVTRLVELVRGPLAEVDNELVLLSSGSPDDLLAMTGEHVQEFREAVALARKYCNVQREALLNKLSRAFQKPDFCVKRDALGPERDRLLPITLSWDADWYSGKKIDLSR